MRGRGKYAALSCSRTAHTRYDLAATKWAVLGACAQVRPTHSPRKRGCCAGEPTWMPFLREKKVQEREGGTDEIGSGT